MCFNLFKHALSSSHNLFSLKNLSNLEYRNSWRCSKASLELIKMKLNLNYQTKAFLKGPTILTNVGLICNYSLNVCTKDQVQSQIPWYQRTLLITFHAPKVIKFPEPSSLLEYIPGFCNLLCWRPGLTTMLRFCFVHPWTYKLHCIHGCWDLRNIFLFI